MYDMYYAGVEMMYDMYCAGVEIMYEMYCPLVANVETLRLEQRVDPHLRYLRDALPEYSTFPQDMEQELVPEGSPVPVNPLQVRSLRVHSCLSTL